MDRDVARTILEIPADATTEQLRAAYRRRAFATHPDRAGGDAAAFRAVCDAYDVLSNPALPPAQEPGSADEPEVRSQVPPSDAAKVLFEYLSDLASEMILNGATPEMIVSFLAREGCPDSVARALERDLRAGVQRGAGDRPAEAAVAEPPLPPKPVPPSVTPGPRVKRSRRSSAIAFGGVVVLACVAGAWIVGAPARSSESRSGVAASAIVAPPAAVAPAAVAPTAVAPSQPARPVEAGARAPARPPSPPRAGARSAPRLASLDGGMGSLGAASAALDADRDALEADQRRFAALVAELDTERARIDADEARLATASDVERFSTLASRKAAYNARIAAARRMEKDLERRVRDLNARIATYNDRVRAAR